MKRLDDLREWRWNIAGTTCDPLHRLIQPGLGQVTEPLEKYSWVSCPNAQTRWPLKNPRTPSGRFIRFNPITSRDGSDLSSSIYT